MSYKTILVHADQSVHAPARIRCACELATTHDAHLIGAAATGVSRFMNLDSGLDIERSVVAGYLDRLHAQACEALARFEAQATEAGVKSFEPRLVADDPEGALMSLAQFADLIVLSQTDRSEVTAGMVHDLPEYVVLHSARPVLLLPSGLSDVRLAGKALVAWSGSLESTRALSHALPLLRSSSEVLIVRYQTQGSPGLSTQAADLQAWLARHGVTARVELHPGSLADGTALLKLAASSNTNLIVMGAYGHTRIRELVLGGVTRTMLGSMTTPVMMAH